MIPDDIYFKIMQTAIKAPSGHNTQPWLFTNEDDDAICVKPDFNRALPIADPCHRELWISLGCLAETAMIAARFFGYNPSLQFNASSTDCQIKIMLQKDDTVEQPELFSHIESRQTTRNLYQKQSIPEQYLETLKTSATESDITIRLFTGKSEIQHFGPYIAEANDSQMGSQQFKTELIKWMRFSKKEAVQKGDGLYTACNGVPSMGRLIGTLVLKRFLSAKSEEKRLLIQLDNTPALAMFTSHGDDMEFWVRTGRAFQRFALTATKLGLSHSYLNLPCQIPEVRDKMISEFGLTGEFPS